MPNAIANQQKTWNGPKPPMSLNRMSTLSSIVCDESKLSGSGPLGLSYAVLPDWLIPRPSSRGRVSTVLVSSVKSISSSMNEFKEAYAIELSLVSLTSSTS